MNPRAEASLNSHQIKRPPAALTENVVPTKQKQADPIVWAMDPIEHEIDRMKPLVNAINLWRGSTPTAILPVSVLSPVDLRWPTEFEAPISEELIRVTSAFLKPPLQEILSTENIEPQILVETQESQRLAALRLIKYAKRHHAQMIAVNTHGRRGFRRLMLGSFAELLLTHSNIPLLTVNPNTQVSDKLETIAFATDFSDHSKRSFQKVIKWAKLRNLKLKVLHTFNFSTSFLPPAYSGLTVSAELVDEAWAMAEEDQKKEGTKWVHAARDVGVDAELAFSNRPGALGEKIVELCNESKADIMAMSVAHGPLSIAFLGGSIRDVLATSRCPVILIHAT